MAVNDQDKRIFKRYSKESEFLLRLETGTYNCRTVDYSAEGVCIHFIENAPELDMGKVIEIKLEDPDVEFHGEVVWTRKAESGLIVGFKRIGNIKGSCHDFRLPDILLGLQRSTKTGVLEIITGSKFIKVHIKNGDMIFANSNQEDERFGEILIKAGKITLEQYFEAVEDLKRTGKKMGKIFVEKGYLKANELLWAVRHQVEEIIVALLTVECGRFEFKEGSLPTDETITLKLSAANLIYRGVKRIMNFQYILQDFPPLETLLCLSQDPMDLFQDLSLDETDRQILSYIDGKNTVREILSQSPARDFETIKTIYALLSARIITIMIKGTPSVVSPEDVTGESEIGLDEEYVKAVERMYETCKTGDYYTILNVKEWTPLEEIKKVYFNLAKEFHPDKHFSLQSEEIKQKLNEIFAHVTEAYQTLSNKEAKGEYDKSHARGEETVDSQETVSKTELANTRFSEGRARMQSGDYSDAEQLFAQAINLDGANSVFHYYHGIALCKRNAFKEAARAFEKAIQINPQKAHYYAELGNCFLNLGFKQRAKGNFEKALQMSPTNKAALEGMQQIG